MKRENQSEFSHYMEKLSMKMVKLLPIPTEVTDDPYSKKYVGKGYFTSPYTGEEIRIGPLNLQWKHGRNKNNGQTRGKDKKPRKFNQASLRNLKYHSK